MQKIRASNNKHIAGAPFRLLRQLDFIDYSEGYPLENSRQLHENQVDLALIPIVDYAMHGGYGALDFGMGCRQRSGSMIIHALKDIRKLKKIHLYANSRTSQLILEILLKEYWQTNPVLVRHQQHDLFEFLSADEGILNMHDLPGSLRNDLPVCEDLATAWYKHTGLPAVFLIWATRPNVLSSNQLKAINQCLHIGSRNKLELVLQEAESYGAEGRASAEFIEDNRRFYLDDFLQKGLELIVSKGAQYNIIPTMETFKFSHSIKESHPVLRKKSFSNTELFDNVALGKPLSICQALQLIETANLKQLQRVSKIDTPEIEAVPRKILTLDEDQAILLINRVLNNFSDDYQCLQLNLTSKLLNLKEVLWLFKSLKDLTHKPLVGLNCKLIKQLAINSNKAVATISSELIENGLTDIAPQDGEILLTTKLMEADQNFSVDDWLSIHRTFHLHDLPTMCCMRLSERDSWEERFVHLEKLRSLQHEAPGFRSFFLADADSANLPTEELERVSCVIRLFLSNIRWNKQPQFFTKTTAHLNSEFKNTVNL